MKTNIQKFHEFLDHLSKNDDTAKFWIQFVYQDAMGYITLFLAIRSGDWYLRMASMKLIAPLFTAFDHKTYQKLIGDHLTDLMSIPTSVLTMFQQGAFVISIRGKPWHSVGIDEAHEMLINKECKTSIVRPSKDYINRIAQYIPYRTRSIENFKQQLFPEQEAHDNTLKSPFTNQPNDKKFQANVQANITDIRSHGMFETTHDNRGLVNPFSSKKPSKEQYHDLMNFRAIGNDEFLTRIKYTVLRESSVQAPNRKKRLQTFTERTVTRQRLSQVERDRQLILSAMRKKMLFSKRTGTPIETPGEQLLELPMAICDHNGNPNKGQKSYTTRCLETRYNKSVPSVFSTELPSIWKQECCLIEGMFLIHTAPLGTHKTLGQYANFLIRRHILPQFHKGSTDVHVKFDNPGRLPYNPKQFEHNRRDKTVDLQGEHYCNALWPGTR